LIILPKIFFGKFTKIGNFALTLELETLESRSQAQKAQILA